MLPLSPAFFAFAGIAIALCWAFYRWPSGRLVVLLEMCIRDRRRSGHSRMQSHRWAGLQEIARWISC